MRLRSLRLPLLLLGVGGVGVISRAAPRSEKVVGVQAWTNGSQTYIRSRPSAETPAVAKVMRHTPLYVWGKFNGWYRVETHDHIFGWVHNDYINSPEITKVRELSHYKARVASNRSSSQTMYGSKEQLKDYYVRYGGTGALKGLKKHGVTLVKTPAPKPKPVYVAAVTPVPVRPATPIVVAPRVPVAQIETPTASGTSRVSALGAGMLAKLPEGQTPGSLLSSPPPVTPQSGPRITPPANVAPRAVPSVVRTSGPRPMPPISMSPYKTATTSSAPIYPSVAQVHAARVRANAVAHANAVAVNKAARVTKWKNTVAWRQKQHQERWEARENAHKWRVTQAQRHQLARTQGKTYQRQQLSLKVGLVPKGKPPVTLGNGQLAPISPEELAKGRDSYLDNRKKRYEREPLSPVGNVAPLPGSSTPLSPAPSGTLTPTTPGSITPSAYHRGTGGAHMVLTGGTLASYGLSSRGGSLMQATFASASMGRGGSPRDRYALMARANQKMATDALAYRGMPYIRGAASPSRGFDCSGLVFFLLRRRGYNPPRTAAGYRNYGAPVARGQWQPGDLILFANTYKRGISHIGVYLGNSNFIHAATSGTGVRVDSLNSGYYSAKYYGARRVK